MSVMCTVLLKAPKFNVISSPNNWTKAVKAIRNNVNMSKYKLDQFQFWKDFYDFLKRNKSTLKLRNPDAKQCIYFSVGKSKTNIEYMISIRDSYMRCGLYIADDHALFYKLLNKKISIEKELGFEMEWNEQPDEKVSRITIQKEMNDITSEQDREEVFQWGQKAGEEMIDVFSKYF